MILSTILLTCIFDSPASMFESEFKPVAVYRVANHFFGVQRLTEFSQLISVDIQNGMRLDLEPSKLVVTSLKNLSHIKDIHCIDANADGNSIFILQDDGIKSLPPTLREQKLTKLPTNHYVWFSIDKMGRYALGAETMKRHKYFQKLVLFDVISKKTTALPWEYDLGGYEVPKVIANGKKVFVYDSFHVKRWVDGNLKRISPPLHSVVDIATSRDEIQIMLQKFGTTDRVLLDIKTERLTKTENDLSGFVQNDPSFGFKWVDGQCQVFKL